MEQLFSNYNFCGLKEEYSKKEDSRFIILPVPYESTTTYGHGTAHGPNGIINASLNMEVYDEELRQETFKLGIHTLPFLEPNTAGPEYMIDELSDFVYKEINSYNKDKILICLGGEHSISPGLVKGFRKKYSNLSILHLDAHADLRDSYQETQFSHACAVRRILEFSPVVSCGIRSLSKEEADFIEESGQKIFWGNDALKNPDKVSFLLKDEVYITLDVDVLDPSVMPATGTPEPDGWTWRELNNFLKDIILSKNIVGIDIVELSPIPGISAPDFSIAKLIYRIMGYIALSKRWIKDSKKENKVSTQKKGV